MKIKHIKIKNFQNIKELEENLANINLVKYQNFPIKVLNKLPFFNAIKWVFGEYFFKNKNMILVKENVSLEKLRDLDYYFNGPFPNEKEDSTIEVSVEVEFEFQSKNYVAKRCSKFINNNELVYDETYLNNEKQKVSLSDKFPIKYFMGIKQSYELREINFFSNNGFKLEKLNDIALSIKKPSYKNIYLKYDEYKNLQWYDKNNHQLYLDGLYSESEQTMLYLYNFVIKAIYMEYPIMLLFDELNIDFANMDIVLNNIQGLLSNQMIFVEKIRKTNDSIENYLNRKSYKEILLNE
ncbi:MAG: hypothetical protein PHX62_00035 [Bacilli bacterium]|nr:hypothetical protein [Bacilli bacterium]